MAVLVLGIGLVDGLVMLVSPRRWFDLPSWLGCHGSMRRTMLSTWGGRFQIRTLGLILTVVVVYMAASALLSLHRTGGEPAPRVGAGGSSVVYFVFCGATCAGIVGTGLAVLLKPAWCLRKWGPVRLPERLLSEPGLADAQRRAADPFLPAARVFGLVEIAVGLYVAWSCFHHG